MQAVLREPVELTTSDLYAVSGGTPGNGKGHAYGREMNSGNISVIYYNNSTNIIDNSSTWQITMFSEHKQHSRAVVSK
jgi:hypothetical protein